MNGLKKISGKILQATAQLISVIFDILISILEVIVTVVNTIAKGILGFLGMGGCLLFFIFAGPVGIALLFNPFVLLTLLFFVIFPILGTKFISYLKYVKYMLTEFLFDRANNLIHGIDNQFKSFSEYGDTYKKAKSTEKRQQQQQRQAQQQREWEQRFKQWHDYQNSQQSNTGYGSYGNFSGFGNNNGQTYSNPTVDFKNKYEQSCDVLSIGYESDKYQIKLAYRKKAKQYHPDMNKSADATKIFQKINDAYEFLSESNIDRYKNMK